MTPLVVDRLAQLDKLKLDHGGHTSFDQGHCATELVSWLADEPFSDHPACLSPVLGVFLRNWNDSLDEDGRQKLKPFLPRTIGTANDGYDEERAWLATDWLVRVCAPAWLELAGVKESPLALRSLPVITKDSVGPAQPIINKAHEAGDAARDAARVAARVAAWAAAGDAAWAAAGDAAGAAARAAARDAARDAAWAAAGAAARAAAGDAAGAAARDAAWAAAGAAARVAAGAAARDAAWAAAWAAAGAAARAAARAAAGAAAWAAAGDAASKKLEPTKIELQASAYDLLDRLIALGEADRNKQTTVTPA